MPINYVCLLHLFYGIYVHLIQKYKKVISSYLQAFCKFSGWEGTSSSCQGTMSLPNLLQKDNSN